MYCVVIIVIINIHYGINILPPYCDLFDFVIFIISVTITTVKVNVSNFRQYQYVRQHHHFVAVLLKHSYNHYRRPNYSRW